MWAIFKVCEVKAHAFEVEFFVMQETLAQSYVLIFVYVISNILMSYIQKQN